MEVPSRTSNALPDAGEIVCWPGAKTMTSGKWFSY